MEFILQRKDNYNMFRQYHPPYTPILTRSNNIFWIHGATDFISSSSMTPGHAAPCRALWAAPGNHGLVRCSCWHWHLWWRPPASCSRGSSGRPEPRWTSGWDPSHSGRTPYLPIGEKQKPQTSPRVARSKNTQPPSLPAPFPYLQPCNDGIIAVNFILMSNLLLLCGLKSVHITECSTSNSRLKKFPTMLQQMFLHTVIPRFLIGPPRIRGHRSA